MNIQKVKNKGIKGLEVSYMKFDLVSDLSYANEYTTKYKMPVHVGLNEMFNKLIPHLIKICGLSVESEVEVNCITSNGNQFLISGKVTVLNGQVYAINTPLIKEEAEYAEHDNVLTIVNEIYTETKIYADKKKKVDVKQFVMDFNKKKEGYNQADFDEMSDGEARELMIAALEKTGAIIIDREDISETTEEENGKVIEMIHPEKEVKKKVAVN